MKRGFLNKHAAYADLYLPEKTGKHTCDICGKQSRTESHHKLQFCCQFCGSSGGEEECLFKCQKKDEVILKERVVI